MGGDVTEAALLGRAFGGRYLAFRHLKGGGGIETFVADDLETGSQVVLKVGDGHRAGDGLSDPPRTRG